jgi:hypothetical protein
MDRRSLFFLVFVFTLVSTILVAGISYFVGNTAFNTVIYALVTMWVVGIISQLLLQNIYQAIIKPLEDERMERRRKGVEQELNLEEVEAIVPGVAPVAAGKGGEEFSPAKVNKASATGRPESARAKKG